MKHHEVIELFVYEENGFLKKRASNVKPYPWYERKDGYYQTMVRGKHYLLHRLVWLYHYGRFAKEIDHINGNKKDNRIENLRSCTRQENLYNSKKRKDNKTGYKGVVYCPVNPFRPYRAQIRVNGKRIYLGFYDNLTDAGEAYMRAAEKYAGTFARRA